MENGGIYTKMCQDEIQSMKKTAKRIDKIIDEIDSQLTNIEETLTKNKQTKNK